jgi:hypothetical protein
MSRFQPCPACKRNHPIVVQVIAQTHCDQHHSLPTQTYLAQATIPRGDLEQIRLKLGHGRYLIPPLMKVLPVDNHVETDVQCTCSHARSSHFCRGCSQCNCSLYEPGAV